MKNHASSIKNLESQIDKLARAAKARLDGASTGEFGKVQVNAIDDKFNGAQIATTTLIANQDNILPHSGLSFVEQVRRVITTSTILEGLPRKREDLRSFYIPLSIYTIENVNAFADLGASINVMLLLIFKRLGLDDMKEIKIDVEVAKRCLMKPLGIAENILVEVEGFIFPMDFFIIDIKETPKLLMILGRPFLATTHVRTDMTSRNVSIEVGGVKIIVNMDRFIKDKVKHYASVYILEIVDA
ncbi:reverse transcriptase domain-containing protein, partial [Tanacetum coccineum]